MSQNRNKLIFLGILLISFLFSNRENVGFASAPMLSVSCTDTIAGYSALCKNNSIVAPYTTISFKVTKPDGSVIRFPCNTDTEGNAKCDLNFYHTRQSGVYTVGASLFGYEEADLQESVFRVFSDTVSPTHSSFEATKLSIPANGREYTYLTVILKDSYDNPIPQHTVEIISSRSEDIVETIRSSISDQEGKVSFKVVSKSVGISTFIAKDVSSGITLIERPKIVFYAEQTPTFLSTNNSSLLRADILSSSYGGGTAASFSLTINPNEPQVGVPFDITVQAIDSTGNPSIGYQGTILFSTEDDPNATLPLANEGYTFTGKDDNASHTFSKAVIFKTTGTKRLKVTDVDNPDVEAEKVISIVSGSSPSNSNSDILSSNITISTPTAGSTYADTKIDIVGKMNPNTTYKVFDTDVEIGNGTSDKDGNFFFSAKGLADGKHSFKVMGTSDVETSSPEVVVFVDTKLPVLRDIVIAPESNIIASSPVQISLLSEPKLSKAQITVDGIAYTLAEDPATPGTYKSTFNAPAKEGEYLVTVTLINSLGKESILTANKKLIVSESAVFTVTGLQGTAGDIAGSVLLTWSALLPSLNIKQYIIYYDTNPISLSNKFISPDANPMYVVKGLQPGGSYYFSVTAVNQEGLEGEKSDIIPVTAKKGSNKIENIKTLSGEDRITLSWDDPGNPAITRYNIEYGIRSKEYLEKALTKNSTATWYIPDLIKGRTYYFTIHALDQNNVVLLTSDEISAVVGGQPLHVSACVSSEVSHLRTVIRGNQKVLVWNAVPGVSLYRVYAGIQQGIFNLPPRDVSEAFYVIPDTTQEYPYHFFAVKTVCGETEQDDFNFSHILKVGTGPEAIVLAVLSFITLFVFRRYWRKGKELRG